MDIITVEYNTIQNNTVAELLHLSVLHNGGAMIKVIIPAVWVHTFYIGKSLCYVAYNGTVSVIKSVRFPGFKKL